MDAAAGRGQADEAGHGDSGTHRADLGGRMVIRGVVLGGTCAAGLSILFVGAVALIAPPPDPARQGPEALGPVAAPEAAPVRVPDRPARSEAVAEAPAARAAPAETAGLPGTAGIALPEGSAFARRREDGAPSLPSTESGPAREVATLAPQGARGAPATPEVARESADQPEIVTALVPIQPTEIDGEAGAPEPVVERAPVTFGEVAGAPKTEPSEIDAPDAEDVVAAVTPVPRPDRSVPETTPLAEAPEDVLRIVPSEDATGGADDPGDEAFEIAGATVEPRDAAETEAVADAAGLSDVSAGQIPDGGAPQVAENLTGLAPLGDDAVEEAKALDAAADPAEVPLEVAAAPIVETVGPKAPTRKADGVADVPATVPTDMVSDVPASAKVPVLDLAVAPAAGPDLLTVAPAAGPGAGNTPAPAEVAAATPDAAPDRDAPADPAPQLAEAAPEAAAPTPAAAPAVDEARPALRIVRVPVGTDTQTALAGIDPAPGAAALPGAGPAPGRQAGPPDRLELAQANGGNVRLVPREDVVEVERPAVIGPEPAPIVPRVRRAGEPQRIVLDSQRQDPEVEVTGALADNAAPFDRDGRPLFSVVLVDDGTGVAPDALAGLDLPVSFALDPAAADAAERAARYREAGHEVVLLADALPVTDARDLEVAFAGAVQALPMATAVLDAPDRRLARARGALPALAETGLGLVVHPVGLGAELREAEAQGIAAARLYRVLDDADQQAPVIARYLDRATFEAARDGSVIVVGRARPETVTALLSWALGDRALTVQPAPLSAVLSQ